MYIEQKGLKSIKGSASKDMQEIEDIEDNLIVKMKELHEANLHK